MIFFSIKAYLTYLTAIPYKYQQWSNCRAAYLFKQHKDHISWFINNFTNRIHYRRLHKGPLSHHDIPSAKWNFHRQQVKRLKQQILLICKRWWSIYKARCLESHKWKYFNGHEDRHVITTHQKSDQRVYFERANNYIFVVKPHQIKSSPLTQVRTNMYSTETLHKLTKQTGSLILLIKWKWIRAEIKQDIKFVLKLSLSNYFF